MRQPHGRFRSVEILLQVKQKLGRKICDEASAYDALRVVHLIVLVFVDHSVLVLVDPSVAPAVSVFSGVMLAISEWLP